jgi:predicted phosphodiesterase
MVADWSIYKWEAEQLRAEGHSCSNIGSILIERHKLDVKPDAAKVSVSRLLKTAKQRQKNNPNPLPIVTGSLPAKPVITLPQAKFNISLPQSYAEDRDDYTLPLGNNKILVISDIHAPYQDNIALTLALEYGHENKCNTIVINGDLVDFAKISRFTPSPKSVDTQTELDITRAILVAIRETFPTAKIVWLEGNHDRRYQDYIWAKAEQLAGDPHYLLSTRLDLDNMRIEFVDQCRKLKAGKLNIMHGHMIMRGLNVPVSPAQGAYRKQKCNTMIGHVHQASEHTEGDGNGGITGCWSTGCLTTLHPEYDPFNTKHGKGFAMVTTTTIGDFSVINKRIFNNRIL